MHSIRATFVAAALLAAASSGDAAAQDKGFASYETQGAFADVVADLQDAVINRGLVIDYVGHVNDMLVRTGEAAGAESPYSDAVYMHFCSAKLTHDAVAASPENIAICPYVVFAYSTKAAPGKVQVGYRRPIAGGSEQTMAAMKNIETMLDEIVKDSLQ